MRSQNVGLRRYTTVVWPPPYIGGASSRYGALLYPKEGLVGAERRNIAGRRRK